MKLYVIAGRGGGVQETAIRPYGQGSYYLNIISVVLPRSRSEQRRRVAP